MHLTTMSVGRTILGTLLRPIDWLIHSQLVAIRSSTQLRQYTVTSLQDVAAGTRRMREADDMPDILRHDDMRYDG